MCPCLIGHLSLTVVRGASKSSMCQPNVSSPFPLKPVVMISYEMHCLEESPSEPFYLTRIMFDAPWAKMRPPQDPYLFVQLQLQYLDMQIRNQFRGTLVPRT